MNEQLKILEMIESKQISASEGMDLLEALKANDEPEDGTSEIHALPAVKKKYKFLKIRVTSDNKAVNVNVNIPIRLLTTLGGIANKVMAYIPKDAKTQMESTGVDLSDIDFGSIIEEILSGTLEDPSIVDVEAWDEEHQAMIKVKIYVD
ncbi:MAG: hypothetical protein EOM59_08300 [Clostridia bacterium]|nr:hypothetical protein [Clostridia bacterium]